MDWSKMMELFSSGVLITCFFTWQKNKIDMRKVFAETVSKSRMEWITNFRNEIGIIVAAIRMRNYVLERNCYNLENGTCFDCEECQKKYYTEIVPRALWSYVKI